MMKVYAGPVSNGKPLFPGFARQRGGVGLAAPASGWLN